MGREGKLLVIAAASGSGKTSLAKAWALADSNLVVSVSHTTRKKRPGEIDGVNYNFVTTENFALMVAEDMFLEHAEVYGNYYGTSKAWVAQQLEQGKDVILEIDWQGFRQVKDNVQDCCSIFVLPPSQQSLRERLHGRGQDHPEIIEKRMALAKQEISHYQEFDYVVINDVFARALADLQAIVHAERLRSNRQAQQSNKLLQELLT